MKEKCVILPVCILFLLMAGGCAKKNDLVIADGGPEETEMLSEWEETTQGSQEPAGSQETEVEQTAAPEAAPEPQPARPEAIYVHICGEVNHPGVYRMETGSRIYQAVEEAGGFMPGANEGYVNQSRELEDGMKIWIPSLLEKAETKENMSGDENAGIELNGQQSAPASGKGEALIDLNTASLEELCTLPGIGASRAQLILDYRSQNGGFKKTEDIMKVEGIKEGSFAKLKDKITVR